MSAEPARGSLTPDEASLTLCALATRLADTCRSEAGGYDSEVLGASVVLQAGELRAACQHDLSPEELAPRFGELLCGVVQYANRCGVDIEMATHVHLRQEEARIEHVRPNLREVA